MTSLESRCTGYVPFSLISLNSALLLCSVPLHYTSSILADFGNASCLAASHWITVIWGLQTQFVAPPSAPPPHLAPLHSNVSLLFSWMPVQMPVGATAICTQAVGKTRHCSGICSFVLLTRQRILPWLSWTTTRKSAQKTLDTSRQIRNEFLANMQIYYYYYYCCCCCCYCYCH